jgi:hypothetical protein
MFPPLLGLVSLSCPLLLLSLCHVSTWPHGWRGWFPLCALRLSILLGAGFATRVCLSLSLFTSLVTVHLPWLVSTVQHCQLLPLESSTLPCFDAGSIVKVLEPVTALFRIARSIQGRALRCLHAAATRSLASFLLCLGECPTSAPSLFLVCCGPLVWVPLCFQVGGSGWTLAHSSGAPEATQVRFSGGPHGHLVLCAAPTSLLLASMSGVCLSWRRCCAFDSALRALGVFLPRWVCSHLGAPSLAYPLPPNLYLSCSMMSH